VLARIFKHGGGSGRRAVEYPLNERDHEGELRENPPELLRGDPEVTAELIDSLEFAQKYTSGVLSFTPDEAARLEREPELRLQLIDSFERDFLAPGMDTDRLAIVWTQHRDHNRTELHFTVANVDLETGKRFPAYYDRADRTRLASWQDVQNLSRGLDDPRAPERQRAARHETGLPKDKAQLAEALEKLVGQKCVRGELEDRKAIVQFIEAKGLKVGRQGKDYITVICGEGKNDRFRLKGALFHEAYGIDRAVRAGVERDHSAGEADRARRAEHARVRLETAMQFRRDYLEKRFGRVQERAEERHRDVQNRPEEHAISGLERADGRARDPEKRSREVDAQTDVGRESRDLRADPRDIGRVRPGPHHDLAVDAQGAVEYPYVAPEHERRQDLSGDRRRELGTMQPDARRGQGARDLATMQDHQDGGRRDAAGAVKSPTVEDRNEHTDERTGRASHGILAAIEQRISAARSAFDRAVHELRGVLHETIDRAQTGAKRGLEALGRTDTALRGHEGAHAAAVETVGRFEQKARLAVRRIDKQIENELDRGSRW
jgi:hypothetical protein